MVFMIVSLKKSIPFVIKSCPKTKIDGKWIFSHVSESIETLNKSGFCVRAVISDNHSVNVSTFTMFKKMYAADSSDMFIISPSVQNKIYLFYDSVHLLKNIRNNLLNGKRFIFSEFTFNGKTFSVHVPAGEISWGLLNALYDRDEKLDANLRKALDVMHDMLLLHASDNIRNAAEKVFQLYSPSIEFCCLPHIVTARKRVCRTISNIFLNNEQKISTSSIRKDVIKSFKARQIEKRH